MDEIIDLGVVTWSDPSPDETYKELEEENRFLSSENESLRKQLIEMKKKEKIPADKKL